MFKNPNPYVYGKMITDPKNFFGRKNHLALLIDYARKMQDVSILGKRRIGKSSLLLYFSNLIRKTEEFRNVISIYIDFQDERTHSVEGFVDNVCKKIVHEVGKSVFSIPSQLNLSQLQDSIEDMYLRRKVKTILCIDEFAVVTNYPNEFNNQFFESLRSFGQTDYFSLYIATEMPLSELCEKNNISSPFYNIFATLHLGLLTLKEARQLIETPLQNGNLQFSEREISYVIQTAGQHPFYTQMLCHKLFDYKKSHQDADFSILDNQFALEAWPHFDHLWSRLSDDEKNAILYKANIRRLTPPMIVIENLVAQGILNSDRTLFSPMFESWVVSDIAPHEFDNETQSKDQQIIKDSPLISNHTSLSRSDLKKPIVAAILGLMTFIIVILSLSIVVWLLPDKYSEIVLQTRIFFAAIIGFILAITGYIKAPSFLDWLRRLIEK